MCWLGCIRLLYKTWEYLKKSNLKRDLKLHEKWSSPSFLWIWLNLQQKSLMEKLIFCALSEYYEVLFDHDKIQQFSKQLLLETSDQVLLS